MAMLQVTRRDIFIAAGTLLIVAVIWIAYGAVWMPIRIKRAIMVANYCRVTSDCGLAVGSCNLEGIAYWIPVNKAQTRRVETLVSRAISFKSMICASPEPGVECVSGACRLVR